MTTQSPDRADAAPAPESKPLMSLGRDVNGRFRSGNPGGPGNPFARQVASLRKSMLEAVSADDLKEVIEAIKEKARQGDVPAARLLLSYSVGRPAESKDPDRMDIDEWRWLQEMRVGLKEFQETVNSLPACLSSFLASLHWACNTQSNALTPLAAGLARTDDPAPAAPRKRPANRAPSTNGARKSAGRRRPSGDAAPSTNGDTEPNGRHEASEHAAPAGSAPAAAPSANGDAGPDGRPEPPGADAPGEHPSAPAPADRRRRPAGRRRPSGEAAPGRCPPPPAPPANEGRTPAGAVDVILQLRALLEQARRNDPSRRAAETGPVGTMTPQSPPPGPTATDPPGEQPPPAPSANGDTEPDGSQRPSGESGRCGRSST